MTEIDNKQDRVNKIKTNILQKISSKLKVFKRLIKLTNSYQDGF